MSSNCGRQDSPARQAHADLFVGIAVIVFCAIVYAATYSFDDVSAVISQGMGPEALLRLVLAVMASLGAMLIWQSRGRAPVALETVPPVVIYTGILLLAFMFVTAAVGMLLAMFILVIALGCLWGERRIVPLSTMAALLCLAIWAVFVRGFGVPLPTGLVCQIIP
jgi:Tripartite tricarboxylate transporter TctB family